MLGIILLLAASTGAWYWWGQTRQPQSVAVKTTPSPTPPASKLALTAVASGLKQVTSIQHIPGDDRLYITEQTGLIRVIKDGALLPGPLLDIQKKIKSGGELGLLGLAFDPDFAKNHYFYVHYSRATDKAGIVARYTAAADGLTADPKSEKILLTQPQPFDNHNGGHLAFGPDGYLYIAFGDGGSAGDPQGNSQKLGTWLGKILRINVHAGSPYQVPADNPFVGTAGAKPEIWALGLRNPWKFSFDRADGRLFIADVGQGKFEEINVEDKGDGGKNYGWRCYEGNEPFNTTGCQPASVYAAPLLAYGHDSGRCSITGGHAYRGKTLQGFAGRYLFGDYCSGEIWSVDAKQKGAEPRLELASGLQISSFGENTNGEIYLADHQGGTIYRLR